MNDIQQTEATATLNDCHIFASLSLAPLSLEGKSSASSRKRGEPPGGHWKRLCRCMDEDDLAGHLPFDPLKLQIDPVLQFSRGKRRLS